MYRHKHQTSKCHVSRIIVYWQMHWRRRGKQIKFRLDVLMKFPVPNVHPPTPKFLVNFAHNFAKRFKQRPTTLTPLRVIAFPISDLPEEHLAWSQDTDPSDNILINCMVPLISLRASHALYNRSASKVYSTTSWILLDSSAVCHGCTGNKYAVLSIILYSVHMGMI